MWDFALHLGFVGGGADLVTAQFTNGDEEVLTAGKGVIIAISTAVALTYNATHALWIGAEGGVKDWVIGSDTSNVHLRRFPVSVRILYVFGPPGNAQAVLATGILHEFGVRTIGSGIGSSFAADFDNSLGWLMEAGLRLRGPSGGVGITLRYTRLRYTSDALVNGSADASSFGVVFDIILGVRGGTPPPRPPPAPTAPRVSSDVDGQNGS